MIVQMQRESELRNEEMHRKNGEMHRKNEELMAQALDAINPLARIAQSPQRRLDDFEGRQ